MAECERTARKISLLSQVGVKKTKLAVNRALEGMGFLSIFQHDLELIVYFETSTSLEQEEFNTTRNDQGLWAALAWRNALFRDLDR